MVSVVPIGLMLMFSPTLPGDYRRMGNPDGGHVGHPGRGDTEDPSFSF